MNTIMQQPFSRVKRLMTLMRLSWQIRNAEDDMNVYREARDDARKWSRPLDSDDLTILHLRATRKHSMLRARRDALRGQA